MVRLTEEPLLLSSPTPCPNMEQENHDLGSMGSQTGLPCYSSFRLWQLCCSGCAYFKQIIETCFRPDSREVNSWRKLYRKKWRLEWSIWRMSNVVMVMKVIKNRIDLCRMISFQIYDVFTMQICLIWRKLGFSSRFGQALNEQQLADTFMQAFSSHEEMLNINCDLNFKQLLIYVTNSHEQSYY